MITMNDTTNSHQPSSVLGWESACFRNRFFRPSFLQQFHSCSAAGQREAIPKIEQRTRFVSGSPGPKDPKRLLFCLLETRRMGFRRILHPPAVTTMPTMTSERSSVYKCLKAGAPQVGLILCSELLEVNTHTILTNNMENDVHPQIHWYSLWSFQSWFLFMIGKVIPSCRFFVSAQTVTSGEGNP